MRISFVATAALVTGLVLGATAVRTLQAQPRPPVYLVVNNEIFDADCYAKQYQPLGQAAIKAGGGRYIAVGKPVDIDGQGAHDRGVILAFDSMEQLRAWHDGPQYQAARSIGEKCARYHTFAIPGVP